MENILLSILQNVFIAYAERKIDLVKDKIRERNFNFISTQLIKK